MTNKEHMLILLRSVASGNCRLWNDWRIEHPTFLPQLSASELWQVDLSFINLSRADLKMANLSEVNFYRANLSDSDLRMAVLKNANLREANLQNTNLSHANLSGADFRNANLMGADLRWTDLTDVKMRDANLRGAIFDPKALDRVEDLFARSVGRLERLALRLSRSRRPKPVPPVEDRSGIPSDKNSLQ